MPERDSLPAEPAAIESMSRDELAAELTRSRERDASIMRLLGTTKSSKIEHDIRNILNELALYKSLMSGDET